ncbi:MAG: hypothetical protein CMJ49_07795 [Planctomycetaceae bacterium]|nr:hypothetical protein [Planctomycetaceae bacterium]
MTTQHDASAPIVGEGRFQYRPVPGFGALPGGYDYVDAAGVATDSQDRVYIFNRGDRPLIVFDADGNFIRSWGEGMFARPHGIYIDANDHMFITDDAGHTVRKFTLDGELLFTLGTRDQPSDTGVTDMDYRTIKQPAGPFNFPTNVVTAPDGEFYVTDGYGNCRVHRFAADGKLIQSWGSPGDGPGQFHLPHGLFIDSRDRLYVCDRENCRIQIFSRDGQFINEWTHVVRPTNLYIDSDDNVFVAEVGNQAGLCSWMTVPPDSTGAHLAIMDLDDHVHTRWGGGQDPYAPADFYAPHDIWLDSRGAIYVGEVTWAAGGSRGEVTADCPRVRKYVRVSAS